MMQEAITPKDTKQINHLKPAQTYIASLGSQSSRRTQVRSLNIVAGILCREEDWQLIDCTKLDYSSVQLVRTVLAERYAPSTVNKALAAIRRVAREAFKLGMLPHETYTLISTVEDVKGTRLPTGRDVAYNEIKQLTETMTGTKGVRDKAILAVLFACGLRRAEAANLTLADYDNTDGKLKIRSAKGDKDRTVYIAGNARVALDDWLAVRGNRAGSLFYRFRKGDNVIEAGMSSQAIYNMLKDRAKAIGLQDLTPHDMRRSFIDNLLDEKVDIATVSKIVGHRDPATTKQYDRRGERTKQAAAFTVNFPD